MSDKINIIGKKKYENMKIEINEDHEIFKPLQLRDEDVELEESKKERARMLSNYKK